jgi:hypothetical protein
VVAVGLTYLSFHTVTVHSMMEVSL